MLMDDSTYKVEQKLIFNNINTIPISNYTYVQISKCKFIKMYVLNFKPVFPIH